MHHVLVLFAWWVNAEELTRAEGSSIRLGGKRHHLPYKDLRVLSAGGEWERHAANLLQTGQHDGLSSPPSPTPDSSPPSQQASLAGASANASANKSADTEKLCIVMVESSEVTARQLIPNISASTDWRNLGIHVNRHYAIKNGYGFLRVSSDDRKLYGRHGTWNKILVLKELMSRHPEVDYFAVIDADAYFNTTTALGKLLQPWFSSNTSHIWVSREPPGQANPSLVSQSGVSNLSAKNTRMNTGFFIVKNDETGRTLLSNWWTAADTQLDMQKYRVGWPWEQRVLDDYMQPANPSKIDIGENATDFNTPVGKYVVHNWWKDGKCLPSLRSLLKNFTGSDNSSISSVSVVPSWFNCTNSSQPTSAIRPFDVDSQNDIDLYSNCIGRIFIA